MSDSTSIAREVVMSLVAFGMGFYTIWRGWKLAKFPTQATPIPTYRVAIWLISMIQGEEAAMSRKAELTKPERLRRSGYYALAAGCGLLIVGGLGVAGLLLRIVGS